VTTKTWRPCTGKLNGLEIAVNMICRDIGSFVHHKTRKPGKALIFTGVPALINNVKLTSTSSSILNNGGIESKVYTFAVR
jgi:hypothetical protein